MDLHMLLDPVMGVMAHGVTLKGEGEEGAATKVAKDAKNLESGH